MTLRAVCGWARGGLLLLPLCLGCSGDARPAVAPVHGRITVDGQPTGPGEILFIPDTDRGSAGKAASGHFESDGVYELTTYLPGDGAVLGHHKVTIRPRAMPGTEVAADPAGMPAIALRYRDPRQSPLAAHVTRESPEINFTLEPAASVEPGQR